MFNFFNLRDSERITAISKDRKVNTGYSPVRLTNLRHNPYVGSFHGVGVNVQFEEEVDSNVMTESKNNPLVGLFRHSPPSTAATLGLKGIIYSLETKKASNIITQLQIPRQDKVIDRKSFEKKFLHSIQKIPSKVFSQSQSSETNSPLYQNSEYENINNNDIIATCSICIESYDNGDEILTLACQHCFHNDCITKWFYQSCLERGESTELPFNCPECRQDHIFNDNTSTSGKIINSKLSFSIIEKNEMINNNDNDYINNNENNCKINNDDNNNDKNNNENINKNKSDDNKDDYDFDISHQSFLHIGANVLNECGYDFLSDFGSDLHEPSPSKSKSKTILNNLCNISKSQYSDCGTPLTI